MYFARIIDKYLAEWAASKTRKPLLLRGARQVGKSTAVRNLGKSFTRFVEINFERNPEYAAVFKDNLDVKRIISIISAMFGQSIVAGKTLLFFDEIQLCPEAIMSLRFFKEEMPELHVAAAGSLLEFALAELPTYGVGRIHSMFMYPMSFDEFLEACGEHLLLVARRSAGPANQLPETLYDKLVNLTRTYMLVGGMPEVVLKWVETRDYIQCQQIQDDLVLGYEDDFPKYRKRINPDLLRQALRSAAQQACKKFVYAEVGGKYRTEEVKDAVEMLILAGLLIPVVRTAANGLPLGNETDRSFRKMLVFDPGIMLRLLNMALGDNSELVKTILTAAAADLVNKGPLTEMIAGLEMLKYKTPNLRHELYYWRRNERNSQAEVDYVTNCGGQILPIEVKASATGKMKSLWIFMREKQLTQAVRCSLENFGAFDYTDTETGTIRNVTVIPVFALSQLPATTR